MKNNPRYAKEDYGQEYGKKLEIATANQPRATLRASYRGKNTDSPYAPREEMMVADRTVARTSFAHGPNENEMSYGARESAWSAKQGF